MSSWLGAGMDMALNAGDLPRQKGLAPANGHPASMNFADDAPHVTAARGGDRAAFEFLYRRHSRMVHGILLAAVPSGEVADLVQDVFLMALRNLHTLRNAGAFVGWLAQISRNRARDFHRRRKNVQPDQFDEQLHTGDSPTPVDQLDAYTALGAIRDLPETYRETLILRFVEEMTGPEIAARTGLSEGSVRVNLHRGMKLLREKLGQKELR